jgi:putative ABC transport system permease protein
VLTAFEIVSWVILVIMALILANAIAMSARERTHEYGVLRAVGFSPGHIFGFIVGESVLIALVGGVAGVLLTLGLVNGMIGPFVEENMGAFFPYFRAPWKSIAEALGWVLAGGFVAGVIPAFLASRRKVTDALRRLD